MRSVNKVILIGNVTRDPEIRQTGSGQSVCTFGLATNRQWVTSDGEKHNMAEFHELVAWSRLADICEKYVRKGKLLFVEGYLKTRNWDTPEGVKKFKTEVIVQDLIMLEKRSDGEYVPVENSEAEQGTADNTEDKTEPVEEQPAEAEEKEEEKAPVEETPEEKPEEETPAKEKKEEAPAEEETPEEESENGEEEEEKKDEKTDIDMDLGL